MTKEQRFRFYLEMIISADLPEGTKLSAKQIDELCDKTSYDQRRRAYESSVMAKPRSVHRRTVKSV